jgi:hypothetical protein
VPGLSHSNLEVHYAVLLERSNYRFLENTRSS